MKLTGKHLLVALLALIAGAVPAIAMAQGSFKADDNASCAQYPDQCTTTTTTPTTTTTTTPTTTPTSTGSGVGATVAVTTPVSTVTAAATVTKPTKTTKTTKTSGNGGSDNGNDNGDAGGNAPDNASGGNGTNSGVLGAGGAGNRNATAGSACTWQPYVWISFGTPRQDALNAAGQVTGRPMYAAVITEPLDAAAIKAATAGTRFAGAESDLGKLKAFGRALGKSLVDGGPLAQKAFPLLATGVTAQDIHPAAGFVLTADQPKLSGDAATQRDAFVKAFVGGMRNTKIPTTERGTKVRVPIVGVEPKSLDDTTVPFFKKLKVSSVDNVDAADGQTDLSRTLAGAAGNWGDKQPSDGAAKRPTGAAPLLCRPTASYQPGDLIRRSESGLPGGGRSTGILMLLGLLTAGGVLAVVERRTRRMRRGDAR